jgi:hypothetical protein
VPDDLAKRELYRIIKHWPIENKRIKLNDSQDRVPPCSSVARTSPIPSMLQRLCAVGPDLHGKGRRDVVTGNVIRSLRGRLDPIAQGQPLFTTMADSA